MVRFFLRMIGFVLMAAAFAALIVDGTRSIAARDMMMFSLDETFGWMAPSRLEALKAYASRDPDVAGYALAMALRLPTALATLVVAFGFLAAGRPRRDRIDFLNGP